MSPELADGFLTTAPPEKSATIDFYKEGVLCQNLKNWLKLSQPDKELRKENS